MGISSARLRYRNVVGQACNEPTPSEDASMTSRNWDGHVERWTRLGVYIRGKTSAYSVTHTYTLQAVYLTGFAECMAAVSYKAGGLLCSNVKDGKACRLESANFPGHHRHADYGRNLVAVE